MTTIHVSKCAAFEIEILGAMVCQDSHLFVNIDGIKSEVPNKDMRNGTGQATVIAEILPLCDHWVTYYTGC